MPGPKHGTPRKAGDRPDPNGNARKPNRKQAAKLAKRREGFVNRNTQNGQEMHLPGSQNRKK
jgi:hypothetical protein